VEVLADGGIRIQTGTGQRARWVGDSKETFHAADGAAHTAEIAMRVTRSTSPRRGIDFETYVPGVGRAMISVTTSSVLWYGGRAEPIARDLDNAGALHTYRLAVGAGGLVQIFRDGQRLAVRPAGSGPDRLARTTGAYMQWGEGAAGTQADAIVAAVAFDTGGAYRLEEQKAVK
jgi:hypothetical protein